jgi:hypothetical protein
MGPVIIALKFAVLVLADRSHPLKIMVYSPLPPP